ncbi:MAG: hypothetical protein MZV63_71160 [Marinilabiliales bacterium]|nr:hypothetical protein [Marinilabiliales bacterium]
MPEDLPALAEKRQVTYRKTDSINRRSERSSMRQPDARAVPLNPVLLGWVIENLVKNSVDAMKGSGQIIIRLSETDQ